MVDAVRCALTVQRAVARRRTTAARPGEQRLQFRIGVHVGDVVVKDGDLFGDGVNVAARLQALAEPGGVCLSEEAHRYAARPLSLDVHRSGPARTSRTSTAAYGCSPCVRWGSPHLTTPKNPPTKAIGEANCCGAPVREPERRRCARAYFSDGITDEIITGLARFRSLFVVARNSSFAVRDQSLDLAEVGRRLGVSFLVQGSVRRAGDRLRVTAQLVEAGTRRPALGRTLRPTPRRCVRGSGRSRPDHRLNPLRADRGRKAPACPTQADGEHGCL